MRLLAVLCLAVVLVACIAAPIHKHSSGQEGLCLICHAAERASVVHVNADAGKPYDFGSQAIVIAPGLSAAPDPDRRTRSSRAPPSLLLPL